MSTSSPLSEPSTSSSLEGVPDLTTKPLTDISQRTEALKLIADSIAQQRQATNYALITHPITLAIWLTTLAFLYQLLAIKRDEAGKFMTTGVGITMVILAAVRMFGSGYLKAAEGMNWGWIRGGKDGKEGDEIAADVLIGSIFGEEMIGALVLRMESAGGKSQVKGGKKALIRAWTTKFRYRRKGVGSALLEEAIRIAWDRGGRNVSIEFAEDHANSLMILPDWFGINRHFRVGQEKAKKMLARVTTEQKGM